MPHQFAHVLVPPIYTGLNCMNLRSLYTTLKPKVCIKGGILLLLFSVKSNMGNVEIAQSKSSSEFSFDNLSHISKPTKSITNIKAYPLADHIH